MRGDQIAVSLVNNAPRRAFLKIFSRCVSSFSARVNASAIHSNRRSDVAACDQLGDVALPRLCIKVENPLPMTRIRALNSMARQRLTASVTPGIRLKLL